MTDKKKCLSPLIVNEKFTTIGYNAAMGCPDTNSCSSYIGANRRERPKLIALAVADACAVASVYLSHALTQHIAIAFRVDTLAYAIPAVTSLGYAAGAAIIALTPAAHGRERLDADLVLLSVALGMVGAAPSISILLVASFVVGYRAAVAQRLLVAAAELAGPAKAGKAIGRIICAALLAILGVRLFGDYFARLFCWRAPFVMAASITAVSAALLTATRATREPRLEPVTAGISLVALWRSHHLLRIAAFQQAALFAAYNAGWATALTAIPAPERPLVITVGCLAGLAASLNAGALSDRYNKSNVAAAGALAVSVAGTIILPTAYCHKQMLFQILLLSAGMALLDAGTQIGLVSNQARVQALDTRGRASLAATLTVCSWLGGAIGVGVSFFLNRTFGWEAAMSFAAVAGCFGFWRSPFIIARRSPETPAGVASVLRGSYVVPLTRGLARARSPSFYSRVGFKGVSHNFEGIGSLTGDTSEPNRAL